MRQLVPERSRGTDLPIRAVERRSLSGHSALLEQCRRGRLVLVNDVPDEYTPSMPEGEIERITRWHERAYERLSSAQDDVVFSCLGLEISVPPGVFPPVDADFLGDAVLTETSADDRVLDLGTGSGINALLAARKTTSVVAVDINPAAVDAAECNADRNHLAGRISFAVSDLYDSVDGAFDLIVFNPPFRWFKPRDLVEAASTDENYTTLRRFMRETSEHLRPGGRLLVHFGTSGDLAYLRLLIESHGYNEDTVATHEVTQDGHTVKYVVLRLTRRPRPAGG